MLSADGMSVDPRHVGHTVSPHEECAVEAAVQTVSEHGGAATVLTVGPPQAVEQLREALAMGATSAVHIETADDAAGPGSDSRGADAYGPSDIADAIASVARSRAASGDAVDLVLLGNDAADTGDFQVGIRLAYSLGWPVLTGVRSFTLVDGLVRAVGDGPAGTEEFEIPLPAVLTVKEGEISPRYPSIPGRLKAKKAPVEVIAADPPRRGTARARLVLPPEQPSVVQTLGTDKDVAAAAVAVVDVLAAIGVTR
jgi:electron transfer flavoprotein beta subunit